MVETILLRSRKTRFRSGDRWTKAPKKKVSIERHSEQVQHMQTNLLPANVLRCDCEAATVTNPPAHMRLKEEQRFMCAGKDRTLSVKARKPKKLTRLVHQLNSFFAHQSLRSPNRRLPPRRSGSHSYSDLSKRRQHERRGACMSEVFGLLPARLDKVVSIGQEGKLRQNEGTAMNY